MKQHINATNILIGLMVLLLMVMSLSAVNGSYAASRAQSAIEEAHAVKADLDVHVARQNGSLDNINSGLNTLKQYRGTDRSEQQKFRDAVKTDMKDIGLEIQGLRDMIMQNHIQPTSNP